MSQIDYLLTQPGSVVGIHPEGTRNKDEDPYTFLRARSGLGQVLNRCPPDTIIVPFFMCGVSSNFLYEVKRNFAAPEKRGPKRSKSKETPALIVYKLDLFL